MATCVPSLVSHCAQSTPISASSMAENIIAETQSIKEARFLLIRTVTCLVMGSRTSTAELILDLIYML